MIYVPDSEFLEAAMWALYDQDDPPHEEDFPEYISEAIRVAVALEGTVGELGYIVDRLPSAVPPWVSPNPGQPAPAQATPDPEPIAG